MNVEFILYQQLFNLKKITADAIYIYDILYNLQIN